MPDRILPATDRNSEAVNDTHHWDFIYKAAERFGMPTVLLLMVLFWIRTDFLKPLLDAHYEFLSQIRQSSREHTERLDDLIELLRRQNVMIQGRSPYGIDPKVLIQPESTTPSS